MSRLRTERERRQRRELGKIVRRTPDEPFPPGTLEAYDDALELVEFGLLGVTPDGLVIDPDELDGPALAFDPASEVLL